MSRRGTLARTGRAKTRSSASRPLLSFVGHAVLLVPIFLPFLLKKRGLRASTDNRYHFIPNILMRRSSANQGAWNPAIGCGMDFTGSAHNHDASPFNRLLPSTKPQRLLLALTARTLFEMALSGWLAERVFSHLLGSRWARTASYAYQLSVPSVVAPSLYPAPTTQALSLLYADLVLGHARRAAGLTMLLAAGAVALVYLASHITYAIYTLTGVTALILIKALESPRHRTPLFLHAAFALLAGAALASGRLIPMVSELRASRRVRDARTLAANCNSAVRHLSTFIPELFGTQAAPSMPIVLANGMGIHVQGYPPLYAGAAASFFTILSLVAPSRRNLLPAAMLFLLAAWRMNLPVVRLLNRALPLFAHPSALFVLHPLSVMTAFRQAEVMEVDGRPATRSETTLVLAAGAAILAAAANSWRKVPSQLVPGAETPSPPLGELARFESRQLVLASGALVLVLAPVPATRLRTLAAGALLAAESLRLVNLERTPNITVPESAIVAALGTARFGLAMILLGARRRTGTLSPSLVLAATLADLVPVSRIFSRVVVNEPFIDPDRLYRRPRDRFAFENADAATAPGESEGRLNLALYRVNRPNLVLEIEPFELASNIPAMHGVRMFGGVNSVFSDRVSRFYATFHPERQVVTEFLGMLMNESDNARFLDLVGARYEPGAGGTVRIRPGALPRLRVYADWECAPNEDAVLLRLQEPGFDPSRMLMVTGSVSGAPPHPPRDVRAAETPSTPVIATPVAATSVDSDYLQADVWAASPSMLFFGDAGHEGWSATVNGERVPVLSAQYLFMAVPVPAGSSRVEFRFSSRIAERGRRSSLAAVVTVTAIAAAATIMEKD